MDSGLILNIQRYCVHDGPGIRTTVFLKGCPLACQWCHNPESQQNHAQILVLEARCIRCGECAKVCPAAEGTHDPKVRAQMCTRCGECVEVCPAGARQWVGRHMTVDQVVHEVLKDRLFFDQSGGGVTFSGGEPLTHHLFLKALLVACKARELRTAVDTCGFAPWGHLAAITHHTDLFLYDLKMVDDTRHRRFTGVSNAQILDNLTRLCQVHPHVWIRIPLIPGVNDGPDDLDAAARFIENLPGAHHVCLLPYHDTGREKFARLGKPYALGNIEHSGMEALQQAADRFRRCGLDIHVMKS